MEQPKIQQWLLGHIYQMRQYSKLISINTFKDFQQVNLHFILDFS